MSLAADTAPRHHYLLMEIRILNSGNMPSSNQTRRRRRFIANAHSLWSGQAYSAFLARGTVQWGRADSNHLLVVDGTKAANPVLHLQYPGSDGADLRQHEPMMRAQCQQQQLVGKRHCAHVLPGLIRRPLTSASSPDAALRQLDFLNGWPKRLSLAEGQRWRLGGCRRRGGRCTPDQSSAGRTCAWPTPSMRAAQPHSLGGEVGAASLRADRGAEVRREEREHLPSAQPSEHLSSSSLKGGVAAPHTAPRLPFTALLFFRMFFSCFFLWRRISRHMQNLGLPLLERMRSAKVPINGRLLMWPFCKHTFIL